MPALEEVVEIGRLLPGDDECTEQAEAPTATKSSAALTAARNLPKRRSTLTFEDNGRAHRGMPHYAPQGPRAALSQYAGWAATSAGHPGEMLQALSLLAHFSQRLPSS